MKKNQVYRIGPNEVSNIYNQYQNTGTKVITIDGTNIITLEDFFDACCKAFELKFYGDPEKDDDFFPDYDVPDPFHGLSHELCFSLDHLVLSGQEIVLVLEKFYSMVGSITENAQILGMLIDSVLPYYDLDQSSSASWIQETPLEKRRKFNVYLEC